MLLLGDFKYLMLGVCVGKEVNVMLSQMLNIHYFLTTALASLKKYNMFGNIFSFVCMVFSKKKKYITILTCISFH